VAKEKRALLHSAVQCEMKPSFQTGVSAKKYANKMCENFTSVGIAVASMMRII
jgi:hypothetical protein